MRRRIVSVLLVLLLLLLVLNSCKVEVLKDGENINNMLYPYLEFTLSEDGSYYTAEIIENVRLEEVEIPEAIDNLGTSIPVLYFAGFKNAKDSLFLKRVVLETSKTVIKKEALKSAQNFNKLEIKKIEGNTTIPELPTIEKEGKEFLGWFIPGTDTKISSGDSINLSSLSIEPRWKEHDLVYHEGKEATCTEDGWTEYYTCKTCSYNTKKIIPKLGHDLTHHEEIKSTCTEKGSRDYYECTRCGKYFSDREGIYEISEVVIPSLGHLLTIHFDREEANCIKEGHKEYWQCERCKRYFLTNNPNSSPVEQPSEIVLSKTDHIYSSEWSSNEDYHYHVCSVCGAKQDSSIEKHSFKSEVIAEPTKEKSGIRKHTCTVCGYSYEKLIHPNGHSYTDENKWEKHEPTCTEKGFTRKYCSYEGCDYYEDVDYKDAINHKNAVAYEETEPTCTENGNNKYWYCPDCGKYFLSIDKTTPVGEDKVFLNKLGHQYGTTWEYDSSGHYHKCIRCDSKIDDTSHTVDQKIAKTETQISNATCTSPAIYYLSCICGYCPTDDSKTFTDGVALGHSLTIHKERKEATCGETGNIEYWECDRCHKFFSDKEAKNEIELKDTVLKATGKHTHSGEYQSMDNSGHKEICSVCHQFFDEILPHNIKEKVAIDENYHGDKCGDCGYVTNKQPHDYVTYGSDKVCSVCLYVKEKQHTTDGGFDIQPETKEPKGQITITKEEGGYKASFILDSDSEMTAIKWFVDNTEIAQTKECSFFTPDSRSYNILCVVFNDNLVTSYSKIVIGGNSD